MQVEISSERIPPRLEKEDGEAKTSFGGHTDATECQAKPGRPWKSQMPLPTGTSQQMENADPEMWRRVSATPGVESIAD